MIKQLENEKEILRLKYEKQEIMRMFVIETDIDWRKRMINMMIEKQRRIEELKEENARILLDTIHKMRREKIES